MNDARAVDATAVLEVAHLAKSYDGAPVLRDISFRVARGQVKVVLGPSGSGKSTMLRLMALLEPADSGRVLLDGIAIGNSGGIKRTSERRLAHQRRDIGMVFQRFNLFPHMTAAENVMSGLVTVAGVSRAEAKEQAHLMLDRVGLAARSHAFPAELSGGQQQRVAIARALVLNPKVMLFDEPTSALDPELVGEVLEVIERLAADGMTMIVVTHETKFARRVATEVSLFDEGLLVESAPPEQFFDAPEHERTRRFLAHVQH